MSAYGVYEDTVTDENDAPLQGARILVYNRDTFIFTQIFSDPAQLVQINQEVAPLLAGNGGYFKFYAAPGDYDLYVSLAGHATKKVTIQIVGSTLLRQKTIAADYDFNPLTDEWIWVNAVNNDVTVYLPNFDEAIIPPKIGRRDNSAHNVTVATRDGYLIDDEVTLSLVLKGEYVEFSKDDVQWHGLA